MCIHKHTHVCVSVCEIHKMIRKRNLKPLLQNSMVCIKVNMNRQFIVTEFNTFFGCHLVKDCIELLICLVCIYQTISGWKKKSK